MKHLLRKIIDRRYCACGRRIVVRRSKGRGGVHLPADNDHDQCERCWKSQRDRVRAKA